jgi:hypothetical protein
MLEGRYWWCVELAAEESRSQRIREMASGEAEKFERYARGIQA